MRNLLRRLHIGGSHSEDGEGSRSSSMGRSSYEGPSSSQRGKVSPSGSPGSSSTLFEQKPFSSLSGWLNPMGRHNSASASASNISPTGSSCGSIGKDRLENSGSTCATPSGSFEMTRGDQGSTNVGDVQGDDAAMEEEYQIQLAMALSVNDDPEAVQIEAVKQISLGSSSSNQNTAAEVVAYRYWNYNALNYDDKVVDDFYDLYGVVSDSQSDKMPSLVDLQGTPPSENISWEAVLVNRAMDSDLVNLEKRALALAVESNASMLGPIRSNLIQKLADLVSNYMGGPVGDPDDMLRHWTMMRQKLRTTLGNMVLPLGQLRVGLARHRALLFKVLADYVGILCRLVKGRYYMGTDDGAVNIIKVNDREYIVDLMGAPGTLIPPDTISPQADCRETPYTVNEPLKNIEVGLSASSASSLVSSMAGCLHDERGDEGILGSTGMLSNMSTSAEIFIDSQVNRGGISRFQGGPIHGDTVSPNESAGNESRLKCDEISELHKLDRAPLRASSGRSSHSYSHARSPSWTEGIGSPAVRRMKVKDVSQYMMDAAKENPGLAQKLHDVLLESGVVAPPNLFTEISAEQLQAQVTEDKKIIENKMDEKRKKHRARRADKSGVGPAQLLPPVPRHIPSTRDGSPREPLPRLASVKGLGDRRPLEFVDPSSSVVSSTDSLQRVSPTTPGTSALAGAVQDSLPPELIRHVPVAAAAAATAAVVASSMVVAASKTNTDPTLEVPVAAAATATAAVVVATSAAVGRRYEQVDSGAQMLIEDLCDKVADGGAKEEEADGAARNSQGSNHGKEAAFSEGGHDNTAGREEERISDKSAGNEGTKSDVVLDDVAEWEIPWEDITLGERIGLGSYGEVYKGDWHGTEVAVKKFLDQDISGDALEEFRSEVRIMRRLRHPNVVLFMGAVTRAPNLSIVTEFLPRGSLYRLIHRPNNQLDERKRLRMALDVAKGMNYLHSSTPVIVHRDLKSPNLLVDKNWVVKVCDFGLSRMKHNTFLSSRSTAGTAEWMAPEVLRNEPSNEKCDVYSFGVILWELSTLQQPWGGMNPMQVVGAVGFQHRRLDIPNDMDPMIADIIRRCWHNDPKLRPSFAEIMTALKSLQRPMLPSLAARSGVPNNRVSVLPKGQAPMKTVLCGEQKHIGQGAAGKQTELQFTGAEDLQPAGS
uniref:non-specific serine/threonine protein kinase n=1 Tax=Araucaria cunninghamii TaxID=56994 RepID=A0A0D6QVQ8_ARACU